MDPLIECALAPLPPTFLLREGGTYQIFKKGGLTRPKFLQGVAQKERVTFFRRVQFLHKKYTKI